LASWPARSACWCALTGAYFVAGFQTSTLLTAGTAALAAGCFFLLLAQTRRR